MSGLEELVAQRRMQTEEELLEYQRQFQQGNLQSSTKVIRAVRKKPAAAADDATQSADANASSAAAAAAASAPSPAAAMESAEHELGPSTESLIFHTAAAVPERAAVAPPRAAFGAGSVAAARTGFPAAFRADLRPQPAAPATLAAAAAGAGAGTASAAPVKKKSLFAQQRDRMLAQQQAASAAANPTASATPAVATAPAVVAREVVSFAAGPSLPEPAAVAVAGPVAAATPSSSSTSATASATSRAPLAEARGIHEENMVKLDGMSVAEIEEAQRELERMLPPELVAMLRARRGAAAAGPTAPSSSGPAGQTRPPHPTPDASYPTPAQLNEYLLDETLLGPGGAEQDGDEGEDRSSDEEEGMDETGGRVEGVAQRLRLDKALERYASRLESRADLLAQEGKLAWSKPVQPSAPLAFPGTVEGYNNDAPVWNSFRVDFEGRFIVPGSAASASAAAAPSATAAATSAATVPESAYDDPSNALYHHGDEADRPGYTMRELLHLARSTVMAQRTLALQVLARVLARIRGGEYVFPAPVLPTPRALLPAVQAFDASGEGEEKASQIPPFSHLLFSHLLYLNMVTLLRLALDDNRNPAGVLATLHCFEALLFRGGENLAAQLVAQSGYKGHQRQAVFSQTASLATEMDKQPDAKLAQTEENESGVRAEEKGASAAEDGLSNNARDEEMCARDLVVGLGAMQFLERLRYILEAYALPAAVYRANPSRSTGGKKATAAAAAGGNPTSSDATAGLVLLSPMFHVLLAFAQHSPQASSKLFDTPRLKECLVRIVAALASVVASESSSVSAASTATASSGSGGGGGSASSLSISSLSSTLHTALLLLGVLCQVHRDMAHYFLTRGGLFASLKKFIVLPNGLRAISGPSPSGGASEKEEGESSEGQSGVLDAHAQEEDDAEMALLLPLSVQALHLWRVCLAFGLDIEAYMDHFPVLLDVLSRAPVFVRRAFTLPGGASEARRALGVRVGELWLQQLRAVASVVEGLVLLFTPAPAAASSLPASGASSVDSASAPPAALSFELAHVVHLVECVLSTLASVWFAAPDPDGSSAPASLRASLQETLAAYMHLLASYYAVLPGQDAGTFQWGLVCKQVEKHASMCFESWAESPILAGALRTVERADCAGIEAALVECLGAPVRASLAFTNLPQSLPSGADRPLQQALNVLFALLRWQESLLTNVPRAPPKPLGGGSASASAAAQAASSEEIAALASTMRRVLASSRDLRRKLLSHFYSTSPALAGARHTDGPNRVASREHVLSPLESEMIVSLLVLDRMDAHDDAPKERASESDAGLAQFYGRVLQLIPALLRNGQQYLASKLLSDVLFHASTLNHLRPAQSRAFTFAEGKLLAELYGHFCYYPEELLVSTLLHTNSLMTPTLCAPVAGHTNVVAHLDTSTGGRYGVRSRSRRGGSHASGGSEVEGEWCSGAWLLSMLKRSKFLQVHVDKSHSCSRGKNTRLESVLTLLRYFTAVDSALGVFTPCPAEQPTAAVLASGGGGAHPMATLFLRALMEFYLLGSDVFLEPAFGALIGPFLAALLDGPAAEAAALRSARWVGLPNHAVSTLMFGASIAAPVGGATLRTHGSQMVQLVSPEKDGVPSAAAVAASSASSFSPSTAAQLSTLIPYHDFHSPFFPAVWGPSFYPFFKDVLEGFVSDSMGDPLFARVVLLLLRAEYPLDYRLAVWRECGELMPGLDAPLPLDQLGYLFPTERNAEALQLLGEHLAGAPAALTPQRNPRLYRVALHHLATGLFGWEHVSGLAPLDPQARVARIGEKLPMTRSPELVRDLMNYRYETRDEAATAQSSSSAPAASPAPAAAAAAKTALSPERLALIEAARAAARQTPLVQDPRGHYGLVCPGCSKPNSTTASYCTGCALPLCAADLARLADNVFLDIINAKPGVIERNTVLHRDADFLVIVDNYGTSVRAESHLDCIPTSVIPDIAHLGAEHLPMLERLYALGIETLSRARERGDLDWIPQGVSLESLVTAGFNHPVSVRQLHLHVVLPPWKHEQVFAYPRWHSYEKVVADLRQHGRVRLYAEQPDHEEGRATYERAIANSRKAQQWMREWQEKQNDASTASSTHAQ